MKHIYRVGKNSTDVLIVGAGPAGLMMACQLALFNISFRIIDKKSNPSVHSGAMIVHARTIEVFRQMGLADKMLEQGRVVKALSVYFNGKKTARLNLSGKASQLSGFPFILMLEQSKTEHLLIEYLQQRGHRVEWETELTDVIQHEEKVTVNLIIPDSLRENVTSDYLVAADGSISSVRQFLNIPFEGKTHDTSLFIIECDADIPLPSGEICFSFSKQATTGFFPLLGESLRIDATIRKLHERSHRLTFETVQKVFNRKTKLNANIRNPQWFSVFHSHGRCAQSFRMNRCILVGDAAHLFTPVGGQGMNTGLQDAYNLAWKLAMVLQKRIQPQLLDTYETERKPVAITTCRSSDRFFKLAASGNLFLTLFRIYLLPPLMKGLSRLLESKYVSDFLFKKISGVSISYSLNFLNADVSKGFFPAAPKPGQRLPFFNYTEKGEIVSIQERIKGDRFHLLIFAHNKNGMEEQMKTAQKYHDIITTQVIPYTSATSDLYIRFGIKYSGWYLIRPDMYIACRSNESSAIQLNNYLQKLFIQH